MFKTTASLLYVFLNCNGSERSHLEPIWSTKGIHSTDSLGSIYHLCKRLNQTADVDYADVKL